jgi:hypothetical protein
VARGGLARGAGRLVHGLFAPCRGAKGPDLIGEKGKVVMTGLASALA